MIGGNDVTGENIVIDEGAVIDGDARARSGPCAILENRVLRAEAKHGFRRLFCGEGFAARQNRRVVRGEGSEDIGKRGLAPAVFSKDDGARAKTRIMGRLGRLEPTDVLNEIDFPELSAPYRIIAVPHSPLPPTPAMATITDPASE